MHDQSRSIWPILAGVRFFLALIVAGSHLSWFSPDSSFPHAIARLSGLAAVIGFLVISGFSIAHSYAKQPDGYFARRARRILPCYVLSIILGAVCLIPAGGSFHAAGGPTFEAPTWGTIASNLLFLQGFTSESLPTNAVLWTLSVEVFFYLLAPILGRLSKPSLGLITLASVVLYVASFRMNLDFYSSMRGGMAVPLLGWAWLLGFLAYRFQDRAKAGLVIGAVCVVALQMNPHFLIRFWPITMMIVALAIGLGGSVRIGAPLSKVLSSLGDASYPLYLFHMPIYILIGSTVTTMSPIYLVVAISSAIAIDRWFDKPLKRAASSGRNDQGSNATVKVLNFK